MLGQRPKSQNKDALGIVMKYGEVAGKLLRPLSAKLMEETEMERTGLVDREKLLDISGRSRSRQAELAKHYGITDYPSPAGGCMLTDPGYAGRLKKLLELWPEASGVEVELIKYGRIYYFTTEPGLALVAVGRDANDNAVFEKIDK